MFGAAGRSSWEGRHADHCQGGHSRATAMTEPCRDGAEGRYSERGVPGRRPSDPPPVRRRPSVAPSARSRGGKLKDCDRADGAPAACLAAGTAAPELWSAGVARLDIVRSVECSWKDIVGTMSNPARPGERQRTACSDAICCSLSLSLSLSLPLPLPLPLSIARLIGHDEER